ncbi:MAG: CerR family C-terminal domain-containing protein [Pseudomonadota bacterium]
MEKIPPPSDEGRKARSDGVQSRERLLLSAMRLFAEQGFAKTSTREIALAAGTNVASISYYFGDKAGLYRAAFTQPGLDRGDDIAAFTDPAISLRGSLRAFYLQMLAPLKQGDMARLCMRLWYREMLEPTGLWRDEINNDIKPAHAGLVLMLGRHLGMAGQHDEDLDRLGFCIAGLAVHLMVGREVIDQISPQLLATDAAIDTWMERLVDFAEAIVVAEQTRRLALAPHPAPTPQPRKKKA